MLTLFTVFAGILVVAGIVAVGLLPFFLGRRLLRLSKGPDTLDLAKEVLKQVGTIQGLLLALVFADVVSHHARLQENVHLEASTLAAVYYDLQRYGEPGAAQLRPLLIRYATAVIDDEWPSLRRDRLHANAWSLYDQIYTGLLALPVNGDAQRLLLAQLISEVEEIEKYRHQRQFDAHYRKPVLFWVIASVGFVVSTVLIGVFRPKGTNLLLASGYSLLTGLVFFAIYAASDPFDQLLPLEPTPFETFINDIGRREGAQAP